MARRNNRSKRNAPAVPRLKGVKNPKKAAKTTAGILKAAGTLASFIPGAGPLAGAALQQAGNKVGNAAEKLPSSVPSIGNKNRKALQTRGQTSAGPSLSANTVSRPSSSSPEAIAQMAAADGGEADGLIPGAPTTGSKVADGGILALLLGGAFKLWTGR
ncbi:MAG: hypothetical protein KDA24_24660 [Deltaproteobacteria bacterium]|nr:hypothetical protein [Deltaproteobacteria bacterium]